MSQGSIDGGGAGGLIGRLTADKIPGLRSGATGAGCFIPRVLFRKKAHASSIVVRVDSYLSVLAYDALDLEETCCVSPLAPLEANSSPPAKQLRATPPWLLTGPNEALFSSSSFEAISRRCRTMIAMSFNGTPPCESLIGLKESRSRSRCSAFN